MAVSLKHATLTVIADDPAYPVGADEWNAEHNLTLAADRILGRLGTAGAAQELNALDLTTLLTSINAQTGTTYTLVASDNGKIITLTNASAITVTCPTGLGVSFACVIVQGGGGQVAVDAGVGVTLNSYSALTHLSGQYAAASIFVTAANTFLLSGQTV